MSKVSSLENSNISRAPNETLQEQVYRQLRHSLMIGRFRPGQALKIRDIADSFRTSMQPVREAIRQLVAEQALDASPNASTRVPQLTGEQLEDLRSVRLAVEGLAAERATAQIGAKEAAQLARILSEQSTPSDLTSAENSVARNLDFHFKLYSYSGSAILPAIIEGLWLRVGPSISDAASAFDGSSGDRDAHHKEILKALRKRDATAARHAIEQDINRFFDILLSVRAAATQEPTTTRKRTS
jgi:DNA-binding GntR family transcriptional regulator